MASHSRTSSATQPALVDTAQAIPTASKDEVESPSLSNSNCLARFEFEPGRSKEGTKVLMVEWEDDDTTRGVRGDWHIEWEGKSTVLSASDLESSNQGMHRMYFLLPPGIAVPSIITLSHKPEASTAKETTQWRTNPLPAIFPPELCTPARAAGKKGVLHTIWAKRRLQALQREIDTESQSNIEGVALTMAIQEKEWIEANFGVTARPAALNLSGSGANVGPGAFSPGSPRTPAPGRLMEKLRGLKLGTSEKELSPVVGPGEKPEYPAFNPLSPEGSDVAVSSFAAFKGGATAGLNALAAKAPQPAANATGAPRIAAHAPPASILAQQQGGAGGFSSLGALADNDASGAGAAQEPAFVSRSSGVGEKDDDKEEGLFALPISPRSPEMTKSPFSFTAGDTRKYTTA